MEELTDNKYQNSRLLDIHRWSDYPEIHKAVDELTTELGFKDKRHYKCLRMVLVDLYQAWRVDPTQYIAYSRDENAYRGGTRYNKLRIKYNILIKTVDALKDAGYIEHKIGGYFRDQNTGERWQSYTSRMRATKMLIRLMVRKKVRPNMIGRHEDEELIIMRDEPIEIKVGRRTKKIKKPVEYQDEPTYITRARMNLIAYNELLAKTYIDVDDEHLTEEEEEGLSSRKRTYSLDLSRKYVHRVFNNKKWNEGGRFYGAWWMDCPKVLRRYIVIDGEPTVELDYSSIHIHLLYAIEKINYAEYGEDAYTLEGYPNRAANKYVFLIAINAEDEDDCINGVWDKIRNQKDKYGISNKEQILDILIALKNKHNRISHHIASGYGVKLQYIDSQIAEQVVKFFTERNIPILTVHDSFICTQLDEHVLLEQMKVAYTKIIGKLIDIGFSSELETIWYDNSDIEYNDNNNMVIDVDRKVLETYRYKLITNNMRSYSQGRRQLRWMLTGDTNTLVKLTDVYYHD